MRFALVLLFLAVPGLSAQDAVINVNDTTIVNVEVSDNDTTIVRVEVMSDSVMNARIAVVLEAMAAQLEAQSQPSTTERVLKTAGWWALGIIALVKLHQIANRPPDVTNVEVINEGDDVTVNVPDHEHDRKRKRDDDHGEGSGS